MTLSAALRLLASRLFLALMRVPSRVVLKGSSVGQDRVKHMASHGDDETDSHRNQLVFPPFGIVHGVFLGGVSWL